MGFVLSVGLCLAGGLLSLDEGEPQPGSCGCVKINNQLLSDNNKQTEDSTALVLH